MELGSESQKLEISTYITLPWTPLCRCKNRPQKALQEAPWSQDRHSQFLPLALLLQDQLEMYTANKQTNKRNRNNLKNSNLEQKTWWVRDQGRDRTEGKTCVPVCDPAPNTARKAQSSATRRWYLWGTRPCKNPVLCWPCHSAGMGIPDRVHGALLGLGSSHPGKAHEALARVLIYQLMSHSSSQHFVRANSVGN